MKIKHLSLLMLLGFLASCTGGAATSNVDDTSFDKWGTTSAEQIEGSSVRDGDVSSNGSTSPRTKSALMQHVQELGDNVDKTPKVITELSASNNQAKKNAIDTTSGDNEVVIGDTYNYRIFELTNVNNVNAQIASFKLHKDEVLRDVKMLNKWIKVNDFETNKTYHRLTYIDSIDCAVFETVAYNMGNSVSYSRIDSRYNENRKVLIKAYSYSKNNMGEGGSYAIYIEGESFTFISYNYLGEHTYLYADLREGHEVTTCLTMAKMLQGQGRYTFEIKKLIFRPERSYQTQYFGFNTYQVMELIENDPANPTPSQDDYDFLMELYDHKEFVQRSDYAYLMNPDNNAVGMAQNNEGIVNITISPTELNGFTQILYNPSDNSYDVTLGEHNLHATDEGAMPTWSDNEKSVALSFAVSRETHALKTFINYRMANSSTLFQDCEDVFGLTFKNDYVKDTISNLNNLHSELSQYSFFGVALDTYLYPSEIMMIKDQYAALFDKVDSKTIEEFDLANKAIDKNAQTEDDSFYALYTSGSSGKASIDLANKAINVGEIKVTLSSSALLEDGDSYKLTAALFDEKGDSVPLKEKSVTYNANLTEMQFDDEAVELDIKKPGKYRLGVYLTYNQKRVSPIYYPLVTGKKAFVEASGGYLRFAATETDYTFVLGTSPLINSEAVFDETNHLVSFSNVHASMLGDLLFDGDQATLKIKAGETVISTAATTVGSGEATLRGDAYDLITSTLEDGNHAFSILLEINDDIVIASDQFTTKGEAFEFINGDTTYSVSQDPNSNRLFISVVTEEPQP